MNNIEKQLYTLTEMPLPKDMDPNALTPKAGRYSKAAPERELQKHGEKVGKGSSRVAYRIHVEPEQFDDSTEHLERTPEGKIDTVIKLALDAKGVAQNEEELKIWEQYEHNDLLLPIIDSSASHRERVILDPADDKPFTVSNWIQMPYVEVIKQPSRFNQFFERKFGNLKKALGANVRYSFQALDPNAIHELIDLEVGPYINQKQHDNIQQLIELTDAGLNIGDLTRVINWGVWKGNPVILDYGFSNEAIDLYRRASVAEASVRSDGTLTLHIQSIRKNWGW